MCFASKLYLSKPFWPPWNVWFKYLLRLPVQLFSWSVSKRLHDGILKSLWNLWHGAFLFNNANIEINDHTMSLLWSIVTSYHHGVTQTYLNVYWFYIEITFSHSSLILRIKSHEILYENLTLDNVDFFPALDVREGGFIVERWELQGDLNSDQDMMVISCHNSHIEGFHYPFYTFGLFREILCFFPPKTHNHFTQTLMCQVKVYPIFGSKYNFCLLHYTFTQCSNRYQMNITTSSWCRILPNMSC